MSKKSSSNWAQHSEISYWTALLGLSRAQVMCVVLVVALCCASKVVRSCALGLLSPIHSLSHARFVACLRRSVIGLLGRALSRHGKSYIPRFYIVTESLEKSLALATQACRAHLAPCRVRKLTLWVATEKHPVGTGMSHS